MLFRPAVLSDIPQIQVVRHLVRENRLSDPALVPDEDVAFYITEKGHGWVCETDGQIVGFAIIDLRDKSVWALFVDPEFAEQALARNCTGTCWIGILNEPSTQWYSEPLPIHVQNNSTGYRVGPVWAIIRTGKSSLK